jgi:D-alanyl-D-alanine carboxypeptidase (penicillin-binding protein 5/6)
VRKFAFLGVAAVVAGMVVGIMSLVLNHPARSTALGSPPVVAQSMASLPQRAASAPQAASVPQNVASVFLAPTAVAASATPTEVPPSPTVPPTATPTPTIAAPAKTGAAAAPAVNAWSVAVVDEASGALLYGRDPHRQLAPASLTKIFTALVALEQGWDLQRPITVQFDQSELVDSTLMGLKPGETYTLEDLLYGLMLPSGNDAALAIADAVGGSEDNFATMMNSEATKLGLKDSHFIDAHGLDRPGHYSSAYDLAMAARYGMTTFPEFRALAKANIWDVHGTRAYSVYNLNRFLRSYNGADGVKIGYTDNSGPAIVASATRNGHRVYVALLHCGDIVGDSTPLFNWVFANFTWPAG